MANHKIRSNHKTIQEGKQAANSSYHLSNVSWLSAAGEIMQIRQKVFVVEQRFAKESICDRHDNNSFHILVKNHKGQSVGCGRLSPSGRVGKIAVLINERGQGIGTAILNQLVNLAKKQNIINISLNAEAELSDFYFQQHFHIDGPVYMKQGVPYQRLIKKLA